MGKGVKKYTGSDIPCVKGGGGQYTRDRGSIYKIL
jgi:hypothetical protein